MFDIFVQIAERTSPIPDLTQEWKESKASRHTAQSPLLTEEPSRLLFDQQKIQFSFIVHIDYLRIYIFETASVKVFLLSHGSLIS